LQTFPREAFLQAGFSPAYYENLKFIAHDEESHVKALTAGLKAAGAKPVEACQYKFPITDARSFVTLASILEGVGSAAYLGAAPSVMSKDYLGIAGSILAAEALHTSVQRLALGKIASASPYGSALVPNGAYSIASTFIASCPSSNAKLPFTAFPSLATVRDPETESAGVLRFAPSKAIPKDSFLTYVNGLTTKSVKPHSFDETSFGANVPEDISGQTYVFVTSSNVTSVMDSNILFGPAIIELAPDQPTIDFSVV
jgi:hypothetical protein